MKKTLTTLMFAASIAATLALGACTQMPTEKQGISDMRPQISFKAPDERVRSARVIVDGLDMGPVGNYVEGSSALRVLPGTHVLIVSLGGQVLLEEKFYVGDGVSRTFVAK
ncbi:MAG: hypothetical protein Q8M93_23720 [Polaromonas sp.]|uniref:hypothetical protein n=1 Tax=Polaromonas sp. TaxID=1869339 RepID=UPI00272FA988|nr:hypothetical protein [Polaromonas sp.]MDP2450488.1 hypothetical protein [Polaromonas sp.]MDP3249957.1 hypothetical protein [Polaromonas sp.]MDP3754776.1 hypothetical protein [Polaromonas sp.]MDP3826325.1 hypothetical protein [Polaromonas sp.]